MHTLITGAAGMIGRKLAERLGRDGALNGVPIAKLTLTDIAAPERPPGFAGEAMLVAVDLADPGTAEALVAERPEVIFHIAGVVSAEAELDFDKGFRANLDGTRALFEAIRRTGGGFRPKVVFTSSAAVFGAPFPETIGDDFQLTPLTSYGTQKAMAVLAEYSRRGLLDGVGNAPAGDLRAPCAAQQGRLRLLLLRHPRATCPAGPRQRAAHPCAPARGGWVPPACGRSCARPGRAARQPDHAGVCCTVAEQIEALRRIAGDKAVALIRRAQCATVTGSSASASRYCRAMSGSPLKSR